MSSAWTAWPDWPYIRDGAITLFWRAEKYEEAMRVLEQAHYRLVRVDCDTVQGFCIALGTGLDWQGQFGYQPWSGNLNALAEGLADPPFSRKGRLAVCLTGFHRLARADQSFALGVLDVLAAGARDRLAEGRRLVVLVQTDDARFQTAALGGRSANWNAAEWPDSARQSDAG